MAKTKNPTSILEKTAVYLAKHPTEHRTAEIAAAIGCSSNSLSSALSTANKEGRLVKMGILRTGNSPTTMRYSACSIEFPNGSPKPGKHPAARGLLKQKIFHLKVLLGDDVDPLVSHELEGMEILLDWL